MHTIRLALEEPLCCAQQMLLVDGVVTVADIALGKVKFGQWSKNFFLFIIIVITITFFIFVLIFILILLMLLLFLILP